MQLVSIDAALVQRSAFVVPEAERGDPAGIARRAAAVVLVMDDAVPETRDARGVGVVEGGDEVATYGHEEVVPFRRFHAERGDFVEGEKEGVPV